MFNKRLLLALSAALAAALTLSASCGGDDDDDIASPTSTIEDTGDDDVGDDDDDPTATPEDTSDGHDDDDDIGDFDVCALLSDEDVAEVLESDVASEAFPGTCDWEADDPFIIKFLTVDIILDDEDEAREVWEATEFVFGEDAVEEVEGIGDRAITSEQIGLEILVDDDYLRVDIYGTDFSRDELEIERELAEKILPKLR